MSIHKNIIFLFKICAMVVLIFLQVDRASCQQILPEKFAGEWKIVKYKLAEDVMYPSRKKKIANKYFLNQKVILEQKYSHIAYDTCFSPQYNLLKVRTDDYLLEYFHLGREFLGITQDSVEVLEVDCGSTPHYGRMGGAQFGGVFFFVNNSTLVSLSEGIWFFMIQNEVPSKKSRRKH